MSVDDAGFDVPTWNKEIPMPYVVVDVRSESGVEGDLLLGTVVVEESLAYMVECAVAGALGLPLEPAPLWPYHVLGLVFEHVTGLGFDEHREAVMALGTASTLLIGHIIRLASVTDVVS